MKKKKELLITLAGAAVLGGIIGAMSGMQQFISGKNRSRNHREFL